jgi:hypothetical protein
MTCSAEAIASSTLVQVAPAEGVRGRRKDGHLVDACLRRPLESAQVGDERRVPHAWSPRDAREYIRRVSHLGHPPRAHERRHLDHGVARTRQSIHERDLLGGRHEDGFVLQAVPRPDLDDMDRSTTHSSRS